MAEEWTSQQCADAWGVKVKTWHGYVARSQAPQPKRRVGRTPVWDAAEVLKAAGQRLGQGHRSDLRPADG